VVFWSVLWNSFLEFQWDFQDGVRVL
jgi:hypothetical protein